MAEGYKNCSVGFRAQVITIWEVIYMGKNSNQVKINRVLLGVHMKKSIFDLEIISPYNYILVGKLYFNSYDWQASI